MKLLSTLLITICLVSVVPVQAFAQAEHGASEAGHESGEEHAESPWAVVFRWANFAVLFGALAYLLKKPATDFFEARSNEIVSGLQRARASQQEARRRMDEIERRLTALSDEVSALRRDAERESVSERNKILADAKREVDRVIEQSRQEIERIARSVQREIREGLAELVVHRASQTLEKQMTEEDQKRVIVRFIKKL